MHYAQYVAENDPDIIQEVQQRYLEQTAALKRLDFVPLATVGEEIFPFSLLLVTPIYWMMKAGGEVVRPSGLLQFTDYYPVWVHPEEGVIAEINKLSVRYYARYADGIVLSTTNNASSLVASPYHGLIGKAVDGTPETAWSQHLHRMGDQRVQGRQQIPLRTFEDFVQVSRLQEKAGSAGILAMIGMWLAVLAVPLVGLAAALNALGVLSFSLNGEVRFTPERFSWQGASSYLWTFLLGLALLVGSVWLANFLQARREQNLAASLKSVRPTDRNAARVGTALMFILAIGVLFLLVMFSVYLRSMR